jgi:tellurite resistance protein TehA-like permease
MTEPSFRDPDVISTVFYVLDIILFSLISAAFITRWFIFPAKTRALFETDVEQTAYLSCSGVALATIVELTALIPGSTWHRWEVVSFALWWVTVAYALFGSAAVYWILIRHEQVHLHNLTPQLLYPLTAVLATCAAGSVVMQYTPLSTGLSLPVLVMSYMMLGMGT